eukprot:TRINITY_DN17683_c0_g1_i1.p1 TRINITY_DN17683_c0_g1~~TRINITY_DN17683_c0_g1_i1.p1  ORF type:complete len:152 (+),score=57.89 TRINITY_DN17683_c0_g1_i1:65-520(+)
MAKSIRSKKKKRIRSLRRELVADHYSKLELKRQEVMEAILNSPPPSNTLDAARDANSVLANLAEEHEQQQQDGAVQPPESMEVVGCADDIPSSAVQQLAKKGRRHNQRSHDRLISSPLGSTGVKEGGVNKKKGKLRKRLQKKLKRNAEFPV